MTYWVAATDPYASGWGPAEGKRNRIVFRCETLRIAKRVEALLRQRGDLHRIALCITPPRPSPGQYFQMKHWMDWSSLRSAGEGEIPEARVSEWERK